MLNKLFEAMKRKNLEKVGKPEVPQELWLEAERAGVTFRGYVAHERVEHIMFDRLKGHIDWKNEKLKQNNRLKEIFSSYIKRLKEKNLLDSEFEKFINDLNDIFMKKEKAFISLQLEKDEIIKKIQGEKERAIKEMEELKAKLESQEK